MATRASLVTPENWVRDYIQQHRNHYPELEEAAETLGGALSDPLSMAEPMRRRLKDAWGDQRPGRAARPSSATSASSTTPTGAAFLLSSQLRAENRTFALAYQLALIEFAPVIERMVAEAAPPDEGIRQLLHMSFANYAAGAIMMPYGTLPRALPRSIAIRSTGCAASSAPTSSRSRTGFTTLSRPGARGVPFFMLRVDPAGNISKRYAGENFPFSRFGGTCPRWNLHAAFQAPGQVVTPAHRDPRRPTLSSPSPDDRAADPTGSVATALLAIGLGCDIRYAHKSSCADGLRPRQCAGDPGRPGLRDLPAARLRLSRDAAGGPDAGGRPENRKSISPYPFVPPKARRLALERCAVPFRQVGAGVVGRCRNSLSIARDRPRRGLRRRAG